MKNIKLWALLLGSVVAALLMCLVLTACGGPKPNDSDPNDTSSGSNTSNEANESLICGGKHVYTEVVTAPTCTEEGYTTHTCACGHSYVDGRALASHSYTSVVTAPTCSSEGYTTQTCSACGDEQVILKRPASEHEYTGAPTVAHPTLNTVGYVEQSCIHCGKTVKETFSFKDLTGGGFAKTSTPVALGADVSYWQNDQYDLTPINFKAMKDAGLDFVILRLAYGQKKDAAFEMNYRDAKAAGLDVGCYYYTLATSTAQVEAETKTILGWLEGKQFEYPIFFDLEDKTQEDLGKSTLTAMTNTFFNEMLKNGYYPAIYIGNHFIKGYADEDYLLNNFDIWYARYLSKCNGTKYNFSSSNYPSWAEDVSKRTDWYDGPTTMWQFSDSVHIKGVNNTAGNPRNIDADLCYKDFPTIIKKYGFNGFNADIVSSGSSGGTTTSKTYVWITASSLNVRDSSLLANGGNIIGTVYNGEKYEVIERASTYTKIVYNGSDGKSVGYISAKSEYVSFTEPTGSTTPAKTYVWVTATTLNVRDSELLANGGNIIGTIHNGEKYEVLEKGATYTKIVYNGSDGKGYGYISAKSEYVSFTAPA